MVAKETTNLYSNQSINRKVLTLLSQSFQIIQHCV